MKEKLMTIFGTFGLLLFYVISLLFVIVPIVAAGFSYWVGLLILAVILFFPVIGGLVSVALYAYALIVTINAPFSALSLVFYIDFALWFLFMFLPSTLKMFSRR